MISRNPNIQTHEELQGKKPDAVVIIMHDKKNEKILLNREFRLATGAWVYNFPAGLIDQGEEPQQSAARELREETGLTLDRVCDIIPMSYSAIGFSNETNVCVVGIASGAFHQSTSAVEEIEARWYTKRRGQTIDRNTAFLLPEHRHIVICGVVRTMRGQWIMEN